MNLLRRIGIDSYMLLLIGTGLAGVWLPARGMGAEILSHLSFWAVALLFFLYGAKLDAASIRAGLLNWRVQSLTFAATYLLFPALGLALGLLGAPLLEPEIRLGLLFLCLLPSTVQSSIAFTSLAGGNVPAAICAASLSNMAGVVLTPLLVAMFLHMEGGISMDAVARIAVQILLPFVLGQVARPWIGAWVQRHRRLTLSVDRGAILLIVYSAFSAGTVSGLWAQIPPASLLVLLLVVLVLLALAMGLMVLAGRMLGLPPEDRAVVFFCGSTKSLASGLPIAMALFPPASVSAIVLPVMAYHMAQLLVCAFVAQKAAARIAEAAVSLPRR